jgi:tetratricopeptide (TPR) repeat protein
MSLRAPLKWAILLVFILAVILLVPPFMAGNYLGVGSAFASWSIMSIIILAIGTWDEYAAAKENEKKINCQKCGAENEGNVAFCKTCSAPLNEIPQQHPLESAIFLYDKGNEFSKIKEYEKALMAYDQALFYNDKDSDIWNNKCDILNILKRYDEAVQAGNVAVQLSPQDPDLWYTLFDSYIGLNNREKADECLKNIQNLRIIKGNT